MFFERKNHKNGAKRLPRPVQEYMIQRFDLLPEYLDMLRCFTSNVVVNERQARCIRIFSPDKAREYRLKIHLDLERHPEVLLYEGYIDSCGNVYVADRRVMSYPERFASQRS